MRSISAALLVLLVWSLPLGSSTHGQSLGEACIDALASDGVRWDGPGMEPFTWDGTIKVLGTIQEAEVSVCPAGGPPEILPMVQRIGCVLQGDVVARLTGGIACGAYTDLRFGDDGTFIWIARSNVATNEVTVFETSGSEWRRIRNYLACWDDPFTPVVSAANCGG